MSIVVYTAACGTRDSRRTDVRCFGDYKEFQSQRMNAKIYKVLAHQFVLADYSIWIDANVQLRAEPETLVDMLGSADAAVFRHCERNDIYEEAEFIIQKGKDTAENVRPQMQKYVEQEFRKKDLGMCFLIVRRHVPEIARRNERWWSDICRFSVRDQLSFPVAFDGAVKYFDTVPMSQNKYFTRHAHGVVL